jgi:formylmethanofuran dehydrogenase subunit C
VSGGIETVNGGVFVDRGGQVARDVSTVNGAIGLVGTQLDGGIETVNGDVTVGVGSHVKGGIKVHKPGASWLPITFGKHQPPRIIIGANASVDGPLVFEREVKLFVHDSARIGRVTGATAIHYSGDRAPQD